LDSSNSLGNMKATAAFLLLALLGGAAAQCTSQNCPSPSRCTSTYICETTTFMGIPVSATCVVFIFGFMFLSIFLRCFLLYRRAKYVTFLGRTWAKKNAPPPALLREAGQERLEAAAASALRVGLPCTVDDREGVIAYIGIPPPIIFNDRTGSLMVHPGGKSPGWMVGVAMLHPERKGGNDGTWCNGPRLFRCPAGHGMFNNPTSVVLLAASTAAPPTAADDGFIREPLLQRTPETVGPPISRTPAVNAPSAAAASPSASRVPATNQPDNVRAPLLQSEPISEHLAMFLKSNHLHQYAKLPALLSAAGVLAVDDLRFCDEEIIAGFDLPPVAKKKLLRVIESRFAQEQVVIDVKLEAGAEAEEARG